MLLLSLLTVNTALGQSCPTEGAGGHTIGGDVGDNANGAVFPPDAIFYSGGVFRINAIATTSGGCETTCDYYPNKVSHIRVWADVSTTGGSSGTYTVGHIFGRNPDGTTGYFQSLDSHAPNSTGPLTFPTFGPGSYTFYIQGIISRHPNCPGIPDQTGIVVITVSVGTSDRAQESGPRPCDEQSGPSASVGDPINVTNGNMYVQQTDYRLPGRGDGLEITRTYNSKKQTSGLFGFGWTSILDESVATYGSFLARLNLPDGGAIYFSRANTTDPYTPIQRRQDHKQIVKNADNSYTLTFKDGSVHQFNSSGKLTSLADRNGNTITLNYSGANPTSITDASGRTLTLTYDGYGLIGSMSDSLGTIATFTHSFWGRLTEVTYADGSKFTFTDTFIGNFVLLTTVKDALNNVLEYHTYDSQGRALTSEKVGNGTEKYTLNYLSGTETDVTDALNRVTKYFFDSSHGQNVVTRVEGNCGCGGAQVQTWTYDNQLNVTAKTDPLNHTTSYTYDTDGNRLTQTDATGTITFSYDALGNVLTVTDQMSGVWTNTYDSHGNLLTAKDPLNNTTTLTYNGLGQLTTITDTRNNATTFLYDSNGNLSRRTDALNNQSNIAYDARGRVTSVTNALNQVMSYEYDPTGRLKKIIYPDTNFILLTFDLAGRRTKIKDPRGYETNFAYDAAYRLTSETNADNKTTSYAYDLMSNRTGVTDALNRTTNYEYDDFNRLKKIKYPEATAGAGRLEENFGYDLGGNLITKTDQASRVTTFCYDNADRLISTIDPAQKVTALEYNARSQMTSLVDAINQRYEFVYNALGWVTQNKKGTDTMSFVYDAAGNRSQRTDYNGAITNYSYDALNRLTTISYPDTTSATYGYDVLSRLTTATNPTGTVTTSYDDRGRVSSVTDVFGQVVSYQYDANSNRTQLSLNGGTNATYQYDVINRLTQLTDNASLNTTFVYDATDKLTSRTLPNGVVSTYQYDGLNRLTRLTHAKSPNTLLELQYQFNAVNNITQMIDGGGTHNYSYDSLDRLTVATHPNQPNETYTYDDVGNRTASHQGSSYTYQAFNRLGAANGATFTYDANGNQISKADGSGNWTYAWDYENRLKQATRSGGVTVSYTYDALGRRVQRSSSATGITNFVYDGFDVVRDTDGNGNTLVAYLNGRGMDEKLRETSSSNSSYLLTDMLGTTRALVDSNGAISGTMTWDSFGNLVAGSATSRYGYTSRELDGEIALVQYRARWYSQQQGRFISQDPIEFESDQINLYAYVANNPLNWVDPLGLIVEAPGFAESLIPIWGSGKQSIHDFQCGNYVWGVINAGLAISDVFLVKSLVTTAAKVGIRGLAKTAGSHTWSATSQWMKKSGWRDFPFQNFHHWLIPRNGWGKSVPEFIKNQPWNIMKMLGEEHQALHRMRGFPRVWKGTPGWAKVLTGDLIGKTVQVTRRGCECE